MKKVILLTSLLILGSITGIAKADYVFGTPTNLGSTVNSTACEQGTSISADGLELYFADHGGSPLRPGGYGGGDLWMTNRPTKDDPWGVPINLGPVVNSSANDEFPSLSADGLSLYFSSTRDGGSGAFDLWVTTRQTKVSPWGDPVNLGSTVNSKYSEGCPSISSDGLSLYFSDFQSFRPGGYGMWDIYVTTRPTVSDPWGAPVNPGPNVNSSVIDTGPNISADGLTLFLNSTRSGGSGSSDLWMAIRKTQDADWEPLVNLGPTVNRSGYEATPDISSDGSTLYFCSERQGGFGDVDLWQVSIEPIVELNDDGIVDATDMCIIVDHWGEDCPFCDIGPIPWGDGVVDVQDLIVLSEHLFEEVPLPDELVAYLRLNEQEGDTASDSARDNAGLLFGGPVWRPDEGKKDGSLQLDGIDDYISIPYVLDPLSGAFTVCAWINGGATGQVIVSQTDGTGYGSTWLGIDPTDGKLMTNLCFFELISEKVITDGQWHHVVLVWNGSRRSLYVDGQEVISDASDFNALSTTGGMYLGAGKNLDAGTFFSGIIDDVRIYNVALSTEKIAALAQ